MAETHSTTEIRSTLQTFQGYLRDLLESRFDVFGTKLRLFVNFCEMDEVFRALARMLHMQPGDVKSWFAESSAAGAPLPLPADLAGRLAQKYKTLFEIKGQRIDLRAFLSSLFPSGSMTEALTRFRKEWLEPMKAEFDELSRRIERELAGKEGVELEPLLSRVLADLPEAERAEAAPEATRAAGPEGSGKPAGKKKVKAKAPDVDLGGLVRLLEKTVKGTTKLAAKVKTDLATDVKMLKLELSKHAPDLDVIRRIAEPLGERGGKIAELAIAIAERAGRTPGGDSKG